MPNLIKHITLLTVTDENVTFLKIKLLCSSFALLALSFAFLALSFALFALSFAFFELSFAFFAVKKNLIKLLSSSFALFAVKKFLSSNPRFLCPPWRITNSTNLFIVFIVTYINQSKFSIS